MLLRSGNEFMPTLEAFPPAAKAFSGQPARAIKVLHLVSTLNIGGLEKVVYDLTRLAHREQVEVEVVCLGEVGALGDSFAEAGVLTQGLGVLGKGTVRAIRVLAGHLRRARPDVLHTHNPSPHLVGSIAARWARVPVVVHTKHGRNYPGNHRKVWANRIATWFTDRVITVSGDSAHVATSIEKVNKRKVDTFRNGIDLERFPLVPMEKGRSPLQAIHVARLIYPTKDQKTLLRAARLVVDQEPRFHLDLVGDGPHRGVMEQLCDELNLRENVRFMGFRSDVHSLLAQAGLFVLSSVEEGLSITLLEAMATGLPIVATRVGGNPEVVKDGETGLLVPAESPRDLADAILKLICDPAKAATMGRAGRTRVEEQFDLRKVVSRYEALYRELLDAKGWRA